MGVLFDNLTLAEAVDAGERLAAGPGFAYVVTPNPEIVNLARQREDYRQVLNGARAGPPRRHRGDPRRQDPGYPPAGAGAGD